MKTLNLALAAVLATVVYCGAQMPGQQPGMGQPGMGQPGMGQPGMGGGIPGMGEPGMGGNGQTSTTNPNMNQPMVDDQTLDRQVHEQLRTQSELSNVHSRVQNGVVYLEGAVPNKKDRKRAEHLVQSVPGVRGVKNELKVEPATTSELTNTGQQTGAVDSAGAGATSGDTSSADSPSPTSSALAEGSESGAFSSAELESRLNNSMWNDPALSGSSLSAKVTDTAVDVEGSVQNGKQKEDVLRLARSYASNRKVIDHVSVVTTGSSQTGPASATSTNTGVNAGNANTGPAGRGMTGTTSGTTTSNPAPQQ